MTRLVARLVNGIAEALLRLAHIVAVGRPAAWADNLLHADEWADAFRRAAERRARECGEMVGPEDIATTAVSVGLPEGASSTFRYNAATGRTEVVE